MKDLSNQRALITGAANGIGRAIARRMADQGAQLWLTDLDEAGLNTLEDELSKQGTEVHSSVCDLARAEDLEQCLHGLIQQWGYIDILVNNAGIAYYGPTENMTPEQWDRILGVNLLAPVQLTHRLLPILLARPHPHVLNIASIYGLVGLGRATAYQVSKFGLLGLSESLRAEYGRQGLGVTTVCPGFVRTNLFRSAASGHPDRDAPEPPTYLSTSAEHVAKRAVDGMLRDRRLVVVTAHARLLYWVKRFAPWMIDWIQRIGRSRRIQRKQAQLRQEMQSTPELQSTAKQQSVQRTRRGAAETRRLFDSSACG